MLPKPPVLHGHKGVDQILRKFLKLHFLPVGSAHHQRLRKIPLAVIDPGGEAGRLNAGQTDLRRVVDDPLHDPKAHKNADQNRDQTADQKRRKEA